MSYLASRKYTSNCIWIEFSKSSTQTVSAGDIILFDSTTKRSTGSDGVSVNSSTGVISLSSSKRYWIQASIAIERTSNSEYQIFWRTGSGTSNLGNSDGCFSVVARGQTASTGGTPYITSSHVASVMVDYPTETYRLYIQTMPANSTVLTLTNLFIMEMGD
ncbi:MAG: hypothetical protein ACO4AM_05325 [Candidatus Nanopelagicaceae bacterium]|jgi:hypothetical protein